MSDSWLNKSVGTRTEARSRRGFVHFHALAFSTLLSSQETDAHLRRNFRSLPGQPLNLTLEFLRCQLRVRKLSGAFRSWHCSPSRHHESSSVSLEAARAHARPSEDFSWWLPGPGPPCGVPSPSGQDELYGYLEAPSNRGFYPSAVPVLTCPNQSWYDWGGRDACYSDVAETPDSNQHERAARGCWER
jgi:hypothetical protein